MSIKILIRLIKLLNEIKKDRLLIVNEMLKTTQIISICFIIDKIISFLQLILENYFPAK